MKLRILVLVITLLAGASNSSVAQERLGLFADSVHSPKKATIYSAVLPGLGQAYNKKYWKIPIVYGAIGGCVTAAVINHREFNSMRSELRFRETNSGSFQKAEFMSFDDSQLLEFSDYHRRWRDNMIIISALAYTLNIIDANVDAHLFNFNVDKNLSMAVHPKVGFTSYNQAYSGLSITMRFK